MLHAKISGWRVADLKYVKINLLNVHNLIL